MSEPPAEIIVKELSDCGVAISGGTSGIGLATAEAFVSAGVPRVALFGRNSARGAAAVAQLEEIAPNAAVDFIQTDCMSVESAEAAVREAEARLQGIDVLVNSTASTVVPELLAHIPPDEIGDQLLGQALAPMLMTRLVLPLMTGRNGGVIVNVSSDAAKIATPGESTIGAAAAAIKMFTQTVALEAKRFGVRVNASPLRWYPAPRARSASPLVRASAPSCSQRSPPWPTSACPSLTIRRNSSASSQVPRLRD